MSERGTWARVVVACVLFVVFCVLLSVGIGILANVTEFGSGGRTAKVAKVRWGKTILDFGGTSLLMCLGALVVVALDAALRRRAVGGLYLFDAAWGAICGLGAVVARQAMDGVGLSAGEQIATGIVGTAILSLIVSFASRRAARSRLRAAEAGAAEPDEAAAPEAYASPGDDEEPGANPADD